MTRTPWRDSTGRTLTDYPRPSIAVDTAVLTPDPELGLMVLQVRRPGSERWALPGAFLHEGERLADAVKRSLKEKAGVAGIHPHQLEVFDDPDRDERGWVLSVAHWAVVTKDHLASRLDRETRLMAVDRPGSLIFDHKSIISEAVAELRSRYQERPDPEGLLPEEFTVLQLRLLHQAVAGEKLDRDWFRREMRNKLAATGSHTEGTRGRPAELFRRQAVRASRPRRR